MLKKILSTTVVVFVISQISAQSDSTKKSSFSLTGSGDFYYRYDLNKAVTNNRTSFTNSQNSFELGMASLKAEHSIGKVSMVADLGFGRRAEEFSYNDENTMLAIKQLYLSYKIAPKVKLTAGSWATHVGYELVDASANKNYSMSYMFSYGPFFHTGIKAEITTSEKSVLMVGLANPTDLKSATGSNKFVIAQFATATKNDKLKLYLNYQGGNATGDTRLSQIDAVVTYTATDKFSVGFNATTQSVQEKVSEKWESANSWWGTALYLGYNFSDKFGLNWRNELLNDKKSVTAAGIGGSVFASTLSANFTIDNLKIIPEIRLDNADTNAFLKSNGAATKSYSSFILAAVYSF
jgi:hypothetical protein